MEPCTTYQNTHHQLTVVIGSQQGETCWPFRVKLMSNINNTRKTDLNIEAAVALLCWTLAMPDLQYN